MFLQLSYVHKETSPESLKQLNSLRNLFLDSIVPPKRRRKRRIEEVATSKLVTAESSSISTIISRKDGGIINISEQNEGNRGISPDSIFSGALELGHRNQSPGDLAKSTS